VILSLVCSLSTASASFSFGLLIVKHRILALWRIRSSEVARDLVRYYVSVCRPFVLNFVTVCSSFVMDAFVGVGAPAGVDDPVDVGAVRVWSDVREGISDVARRCLAGHILFVVPGAALAILDQAIPDDAVVLGRSLSSPDAGR
jgi:hypothetical protein